MIRLHDSLSSCERDFIPLDPDNVGLYVCGPTVYDLAHIGNARSVVVYDVLFRLLMAHYPRVTYVRNITDVDDKIINVAEATGKKMSDLTAHYTMLFHADMKQLNCLPPTYEPRATEKVDVMVRLIEALIEHGHAYVKGGTVYFNVGSYSAYGKLSGRRIHDMMHGSRIAIDSNKMNAGDFVLWKPATQADLQYGASWPSPWGVGRPGWHLECSAMSYDCLGKDFDIHGGGADLMFPHHENELAQSCCAFPGSEYARYWVHNGFLTVNSEKMSKSLGNVVTVKGLIDHGVPGEVIRCAFLTTHYRKPLNWDERTVMEARETLNRIYHACDVVSTELSENTEDNVEICGKVMESLRNDLNTPRAIAALHDI
ncbi:unnamed protein product, partial [Ixodes pacificus]